MPPAPPDDPSSAAPFVPVIPAGGSGTRLWPLSRRAHPKFLLDLTGSGRSLLRETVDRVLPLADRPPLVVTGAAHEAAVRAEVGEDARVLAEPSPRSSMPAIALAAAIAHAEHEDAVIGSFAADHRIADIPAFHDAVRRARRAAELDLLVTLGIEPTYPATGFGYIEAAPPGDATGGGGTWAQELADCGALPVSRFVEKPDLERAEGFVASGRFRWNAGIFVVRARVLLDALEEQLPALARGVREIAQALGTDAKTQTLERVWPHLTAIAIDHALAEPLALQGRVAMVPGAIGWDDVGDFAALARQLREGDGAVPAGETVDASSEVVVLGDVETVAVDARATVYGSSDRLIALVGVDGISVVETDDALLVLGDARAQDLARLGDLLERRGRGELR